MSSPLIRIIDRILGNSLRTHYQVPSMEWSLSNMIRLGFKPDFIVDVGAFNGEWTEMALGLFPNSRVLMLEAQESKQAGLERIAGISGGKVSCKIALMGPTDGDERLFHIYECSPTASSVLQDYANSPTLKKRMITRTLDSILAASDLPAPGLLKLDVQGYELEVLKGADTTLTGTHAVLLEVSIAELYQGAPLFGDVNQFMVERGFQLYDICSLLRRPLDHALCQADAIYVKNHSPLLQHKIWG